MANWATLYRQVSRLPVIAPGSDPRADWFKCERYRARLPKTDCANRHRLSKQRTGDGASYQAVQYGGCVGCKIGAAHAAGLPTPLETTSMDETSTVTTNGHATKQWPERTCGRCHKKFQPATARERRCTACTKAAAEQPKRVRSKPAKLRAGRRKEAFADGTVTVRTSADGKTWTPKVPVRPPTPALKPDQIATAAELLTLAGYTVESVRTPAGEFLRVT